MVSAETVDVNSIRIPIINILDRELSILSTSFYRIYVKIINIYISISPGNIIEMTAILIILNCFQRFHIQKGRDFVINLSTRILKELQTDQHSTEALTQKHFKNSEPKRRYLELRTSE
jgi:hypothetical protein